MLCWHLLVRRWSHVRRLGAKLQRPGEILSTFVAVIFRILHLFLDFLTHKTLN